MILVDTGPWVALFDPQDPDHQACHRVLQKISQSLYTTESVLTEVFHMLDPVSKGATGFQTFILEDYVSVISLTKKDLELCFSLMDKYQDLPMDFADASLVVCAEKLKISTVFTLDFTDFDLYRFKKGHRYYSFNLLGKTTLQRHAS